MWMGWFFQIFQNLSPFEPKLDQMYTWILYIWTKLWAILVIISVMIIVNMSVIMFLTLNKLTI